MGPFSETTVFITVGTDNHDFSRLVKEADRLAGKMRITVQTGSTKYRPKNAEWFAFAERKKIETLYRKSDVVVTHAGAGSIINCIKYGKMPVVVPRLKEMNEHADNHQLDMAKDLEAEGVSIAVYDISHLEAKIMAAKRLKPKKRKPAGIGIVKEYLNSLEKGGL